MDIAELSEGVTLICGDCRDVLPTLGQVDAVVTDPPYGLSKEPDIMEVLRHWMAGDDYKATGGGFMGKTWDSFVPGPTIWREVARCMKPGAYCLSFASTRTFDLMAIALRMAGMEQHPFLAWCFASGFPKATNLSKMLDKAAGAERKIVGRTTVAGMFKQDYQVRQGYRPENGSGGYAGEREGAPITAPATDAAKQWDGWFYGKQSLKPAIEPVLMFQKPFEKGLNGAENVLAHGTGGLNIGACRVEAASETDRMATARPNCTGKQYNTNTYGNGRCGMAGIPPAGRWPANLILSYPPDQLGPDGKPLPNPAKDEVVGLFPVTGPSSARARNNVSSGTMREQGMYRGPKVTFGHDDAGGSAARFFKCCPMDDENDLTPGASSSEQVSGEGQAAESDAMRNSGGVSSKRLFYCAKASKADRDEGCEGLEERERDSTSGNNRKAQRINGGDEWEYLDVPAKPHRNTCPCVKPTALMRYLCRLVTPPGGVVLDPFMGSGSTGKAAVLEGFRFIGIERDRESFEIAKARLLAAIEERRRAVGAVGQGMLPLVGERESYG